MESNPQQRLAQLGARFLQRTAGQLPRLSESIQRLLGGDAAEAAQIELLAHRIRGTAATLGFESISQCADQLEKLVVRLRQDPSAGSSSSAQLLPCSARLADAVQRAISLLSAS